jgi:GAF domain-containing protein
MKDTPVGFANHLRNEPKLRPYTGSYLAQLVETKKTIHVSDIKADKPYKERESRANAAVDLGGIRTQLFVPMIKGTNLIGSINIYRQEELGRRIGAGVSGHAGKRSAPARLGEGNS